MPSDLEQRAIAAGLRWRWGGSYSQPMLICADWWGTMIGYVTGISADYKAWAHYRGDVTEHPNQRTAQLAVLAAWAKEQP